MLQITDTTTLANLCARLSSASFVTVDTEFMRDNTYWPKLCLIQVAGDTDEAVIDPLADDLDLTPFFEFLGEESVLKVFHAARQDLEIFFHRTGRVPSPIFDTQVAAMVCGFGDSVGYETLVTRIAAKTIDKTSRFTDWSHRPLTTRQLSYALADVTHLRPIYESLADQLRRTSRDHWVSEEMAILTDPATYRLDPDQAWKRLKTRSSSPKFINVVRYLATWREKEAQRRDLPRNRILRDEAILEIAAHTPQTPQDLARTRGIGRGFAEGRQGQDVLAAVADGLQAPRERMDEPRRRPSATSGLTATVDLLRVLLKKVSDEEHVASKIIATVDDLETLAADDHADVAALKGWRRELFGEKALALKHGRLALAIRRGRVVLLEDAVTPD